MEVTAQVGPTGRLAQARFTIGFRRIELGISLIAISLEDAAGVGQMAENVLFLPVRCKPIDGPRWRCTRPLAFIAHIGPYPALLDPFAKTLVAL